MGNIYGYNNSHRKKLLFEEFEEKTSGLLTTFMNVKLIFGGDWNSISDPTKNCFPQRPSRGTYGEINKLCLHFNC